MPAYEISLRAVPLERPDDSVWSSIARNYAAFGSPLVPAHQDIQQYEHAVASHAKAFRIDALKALILGVTPGVVLMKWPAGSRITAVDMSTPVIDALWPGDVPGVRRAICASWLERSTEQGVAVREAAHILEKYNLNRRVMERRLGWSKVVAEPFAAWPTSDAVYSFPTLGELRAVLGEHFEEVSVTYPSYELGSCCPTLVMRVRG